MKRCGVFCGTRPGRDPEYLRVASELGERLAHAGIGVVYGGGNSGLMGAMARSALAAGGEVIGVFPRIFDRKVLEPGLTKLHMVETMHERKALMEKLADAFVAMPGGFGTLEEIAEAVTFAQLKLHDKPCFLLNAKGYFDPFLAFLGKAVEEGFMEARHRELLFSAGDCESFLAGLRVRGI